MIPSPSPKRGRPPVPLDDITRAIVLRSSGRSWPSIARELGRPSGNAVRMAVERSLPNVGREPTQDGQNPQMGGQNPPEAVPVVISVPSDGTTPSPILMRGGPSTLPGVSLLLARVPGPAEIPSPGTEVVRDHESNDSPYPHEVGPQRLGDHDPAEVVVEELRRVSDELVRRGRMHHAAMTVQRDGGDLPADGDAT